MRERLATAAALTAGSLLAAGLASFVAGGDASLVVGAALVPAAAALLSHGLAGGLTRLGATHGAAAWWGGVVPFALAGALFVADPWIEWRGGTAASQGRADLVYALNPVASLTAMEGGTGLDLQRSRWLYDGPAPGAGGLSVVGQYYPTRPTSPWIWSLLAGAAGLGLVALGSSQAEVRTECAEVPRPERSRRR